jgi:hypothetical protein
MVARYKRLQLVVVGWNAKRKALGFFGHVTEQVSGLREGEAVEEIEHHRQIANQSTPTSRHNLQLRFQLQGR